MRKPNKIPFVVAMLAVVWMAGAAPGAWGANRATFTDKWESSMLSISQ